MSMYPKDMLFTSESVAERHPDKFCDQTWEGLDAVDELAAKAKQLVAS